MRRYHERVSADDLLGALDLPEWLFAPLLLAGCAFGLALFGLPADDVLLDSLTWFGVEVVGLVLARWLVWPRRSLGAVFDVGAMGLTAVIGSSVGVHRAVTHGVDTIAIVGLVLGPVCAFGLIVGAVRRGRRRRR